MRCPNFRSLRNPGLHPTPAPPDVNLPSKGLNCLCYHHSWLTREMGDENVFVTAAVREGQKREDEGRGPGSCGCVSPAHIHICVPIHTCAHMCINTHPHICMPIHQYTHAYSYHAHVYSNKYLYLHAYTRAHTCTNTHSHICTPCIHMHTRHTHICIHACINAHSHVHTRTHTPLSSQDVVTRKETWAWP